MYDLLLSDYREKTSWRTREQQIADEAIRNAIACWTNCNLNLIGNPSVAYWQSTLRTALEQHTGRLLWSLPKIAAPFEVNTRPPVFVPVPDFPKIGVDLSSEPVSASPGFGVELKRLLEEARTRPEDIAEEVGIQPRNVYRHLAGETSPSIANVGRYERALSKRIGRKVVFSHVSKKSKRQ